MVENIQIFILWGSLAAIALGLWIWLKTPWGKNWLRNL